MKKYLSAFAVLALLLACTPENKGGSDSGGGDVKDLVVTGDVFEITDSSALLTGFANLPFELADAEVGFMLDKSPAFGHARKFDVALIDENNKYSVTVTGLESNTPFYYKSYIQNGRAIKYGGVKSFDSALPEGSVDLGIVMTRNDGTTYKLYWGKSNLCASGLCANPEDYGDYYAWGETERQKAHYTWETYKWCSFSSVVLTKYNTQVGYGVVDDITVLQRGETSGESVDDAARAKLGRKWRMPTSAEWDALKTKCTWTSAVQNNVKGARVTGPNGNSIFLPATGYFNDDDLLETVAFGHYWSSSLFIDNPHSAWKIKFSTSSFSVFQDDMNRWYGVTIRPVAE